MIAIDTKRTLREADLALIAPPFLPYTGMTHQKSMQTDKVNYTDWALACTTTAFWLAKLPVMALAVLTVARTVPIPHNASCRKSALCAKPTDR